MANGEIRVGLIGAGRNTRERHIPGFQKIHGLELAAVANRSRESGRVVADQFNIPTVYDNWQELLEDESLNAVCIGTWPYMHRTLTVAALEKGKHVLCEARMAASAQEARDMLNASRAPSPSGDPDSAITANLPGGQPAARDDRGRLFGGAAIGWSCSPWGLTSSTPMVPCTGVKTGT